MSVRRWMAVNGAIAVGMIWFGYLIDRESAYRVEAKYATVLGVVLGLPASLMVLSRMVLGPGPRRDSAIRACLRLHVGLMLLVCSTPLLLLGYYRVAHPGKILSHRMAFLRLSFGPCAAMAAIYAALFFASTSKKKRNTGRCLGRSDEKP
jgi:hypothetical protein